MSGGVRKKAGPYTVPDQKQHNSPGLLGTKVDLRRSVLEAFAERQVRTQVFDAFCGPKGEMFDRVWRHADAYEGCDEKWEWATDPRRRFVGDNRRVMRAIDLAPYNIFDFDAFGSPWEQMVILAARRPWAKGELGAIVMTDASHAKMNLGGMPKALAHLVGVTTTANMPPSRTTGDTVQALALSSWAERSRVKVIGQRQARGHGSQQKSGKGFLVVYTSVLVEGIGDA
jgi:hypothetical protein